MTKNEVTHRLLERARLMREIEDAFPIEREHLEGEYLGFPYVYTIEWDVQLRENVLGRAAGEISNTVTVASSVRVVPTRERIGDYPLPVKRRAAEISTAALAWEAGEGAWPVANPERAVTFERPPIRSVSTD
jgi:hypothetical protein